MVDRGTRVKKKKHRKTPGGKSVVHYSRDSKSKAKCAATGKVLAGTGNQTKADSRKESKTKRRPSVKFGGVLGSEARRELWENYALVENNKKDINEVPAKLRKHIVGLKVKK